MKVIFLAFVVIYLILTLKMVCYYLLVRHVVFYMKEYVSEGEKQYVVVTRKNAKEKNYFIVSMFSSPRVEKKILYRVTNDYQTIEVSGVARNF